MNGLLPLRSVLLIVFASGSIIRFGCSTGLPIISQKKLEFSLLHNISFQDKLPNSYLVAFGDYNSDSRVDWIFIRLANDGKKFIEIYDVARSASFDPGLVARGQSEEQDLDESDLRLLISVEVQSNVDAVIATDWNFDGRLDILAIASNRQYTVVVGNSGFPKTTFGSTKSDLPKEGVRYSVIGYIQDSKTKNLIKVWTSNNHPQDSESENLFYSEVFPFIVDINNDGRPDIIGQKGKPSDSNHPGGRFVWINKEPNMFEAVWWTSLDDFIDGATQSYGVITEPHSSAFVDIDGDCKADLVLVVESLKTPGLSVLEIWINDVVNGKAKYRKQNPMPLPANPGQLAFADFNADGTVDIVIPSCTLHKGICVADDQILMSANGQIPVCSSHWRREGGEDCRAIPELCVPSPFTLSNFHAKKTPDFSISILGDPTVPYNVHFVGDKIHPITLRTGDYDGDGYPDLLALVERDGNQRSIQIYRNVETPSSDKATYPLRSFVLEHDLTMRWGDRTILPYATAFVDIFDRGVLDVVAFGVVQELNGGAISQTFVQTTESDFLFLKATALNGVCLKGCGVDVPYTNPRPFGVNAHGPTFKITVTDLSGNKMPRTATQLPQSAHSPLALPFVLFGLGRTNNYIEEFFLGMPVPQEDHVNLWISIIPNSQVIAIPYRLLQPKEWVLELSINPSKKFLSILQSTIVTLFIVGALIFLLDRKEKAEDLVEHRGFRSHFIIN